MFALYKKELQSYFLSPIAYFVIAFFMATFSLTFIMDIGNVTSSTYEFSFSSIYYVNIYYFIFLLPLLTMRAFSEERKNGTETLLLSSPLNVTQIVLAKFFATATVLLIMLAASLFYPILTSIYGRVVWSSLICTYIGFFLFGLVCIALGIFISSLTEMPLLSILMSELAMLLLLLMDNMSQNTFLSSIPVLSDVVNWFSNQTKFYVFSQGLLQFSDLLGYITEILVFLIWTIISIEKRRWSRR
ncbi:ABC transporter permease [Ruminococcus sp.]|uniref:ABC transporter permease n=1 Tax=Ruminococcus sp. TaxID=41978 RepID=UPI0025F55441|nr:ABC transporter permease [Ruminococcus sp.]